MSRGKHGPNNLYNYLEVHHKAMGGHLASGFVLADKVAFGSILPRELYVLEGRIHCAGGLAIDVRKFLAVVDCEGAHEKVQTVDYKYHAHISDVRNVFRYCSPHDDHNKHHHVHRYDVFGNGKKIKPPTFLHEEDDRPTLGDVIKELHAWYDANEGAITALRGTLAGA